MRFWLFISFLIICLQSCVLSRKSIYLQDKSGKDTLLYSTAIEPEYHLQVKDVLYIRIYNINSDDAETMPGPTSSNMTPMNLYYSGYVINDSGYVEIPQVGKIQVLGLTTYEAIQKIKTEVHTQLPYATVVAKPIFKISVLGEVRTPGTIYISNSQLTLFEALGYAGDLTDFGNRREVKVIRTVGTQKTVVSMDLTDPALMQNSYFFIKPNDVIYVQPFRAKFVRINASNVALFMSAVTLILVTVNLVRK